MTWWGVGWSTRRWPTLGPLPSDVVIENAITSRTELDPLLQGDDFEGGGTSILQLKIWSPETAHWLLQKFKNPMNSWFSIITMLFSMPMTPAEWRIPREENSVTSRLVSKQQSWLDIAISTAGWQERFYPLSGRWRRWPRRGWRR